MSIHIGPRGRQTLYSRRARYAVRCDSAEELQESADSNGYIDQERTEKGRKHLTTLASGSTLGSYEILADTPANERWGDLSPDGRWLVYSSDESGREEIWLRSMSDVSLRRQVSTHGGELPYWVENGREIEYIRTTGELRQFWRVAVTTEPELETRSPRLDRSEESGLRFVDTLPTGEILAIEADPREMGLENRLDVVLNWFESLEELFGSDADS